MSNYFYDLPKELQHEIFQYIPYKRIGKDNYLRDIQEITMNWFNKTFNNTNFMVVNFKHFQQNGGLNSYQANYFKYGVFQYTKEERFFHFIFCYGSGQFKKIAKRRNLRNLKQNKIE